MSDYLNREITARMDLAFVGARIRHDAGELISFMMDDCVFEPPAEHTPRCLFNGDKKLYEFVTRFQSS